ncbi:MAG: hypothetical protein JAY74_17915 [Candidatus Thiodiazotropha taylori]|nr:hypothetical protein [Candidatus Thiodiazotropha taylori]
MYRVQTYAVRMEGVIYIAISGVFPNSCYSAVISDKYPGGNIQYVQDPGNAQVFIEESMKPDLDFCLMYEVPWLGRITIPDKIHEEVEIFVNGTLVSKVNVSEIPSSFIVIAYTVSDSDAYRGCSIVPEGSPIPMMYSQVFGPGTMSECREWKSVNCGMSEKIELMDERPPFPWIFT